MLKGRLTLQANMMIAIVTVQSATLAAFSPALSAGYAFKIGDQVAVTPMAGYGLYFLSVSGVGSVAAHSAFVEAPFSILLGPRGYIDVFIHAGAMFILGDVYPSMAGGVRVGLIVS